ncbi:MAG: hypothetical protein WCC01_06390 [Acidimicrobiia bacterium]
MRIPLVLAVLTLAVSGCTPPNSGTTTTTIEPATTTTTTASDTPACLAGDLPFVEEGTIAALDSQGQDARAVAGVRWYPLEGCERIEIEFLSDAGAPATRIGPVGVSMLSDPGIVRVSLSEAVANSAVADTTLNGTLVDKWFVVEGAEDGLIVDLHLNDRAAARAFTTTSPARLVIDLRATGDDLQIATPMSGGGIVLLSPQAGVGLYPLQVVGYSAPGVDAVRIQLADAVGIGVDRSISTRSSAHVWHAFNIALSDGPSGAVDLRVGTVGEEGEPIFAIEIPLDLP